MGEKGDKVQLGFPLAMVPPSLKFAAYLTGGFASPTLASWRFDFEAMAHAGRGGGGVRITA